MKRSYRGVATTYIFSGTKPIAEYVGGAITKEYIYSGEHQLAEITDSGLNVSVTYKYPDHLSTRAETDASGNLTRTFGHVPFGETWYETGTSSKWKFTTYERDSETNNDYATFRHYENRLGRFMTTDPYGGSTDLLVPQTWNRFSYVQNDPSDFSDPLGLCIDLWARVVIEYDYKGRPHLVAVLYTWCNDPKGSQQEDSASGSGSNGTGPASSTSEQQTTDCQRAAIKNAAVKLQPYNDAYKNLIADYSIVGGIASAFYSPFGLPLTGAGLFGSQVHAVKTQQAPRQQIINELDRALHNCEVRMAKSH